MELSSLILTWTNNPQHFIAGRRQLLTDVLLSHYNWISDQQQTQMIERKEQFSWYKTTSCNLESEDLDIIPCLTMFSWMSNVEYGEMESSDEFMTKLLNIWESSSMRVTLRQDRACPGFIIQQIPLSILVLGNASGSPDSTPSSRLKKKGWPFCSFLFQYIFFFKSLVFIFL